jgi:ribonucleoside-diphosphate reductase subunit M1
MQRVQNNEDWSLFCPNEAPGLADCWGEKFEDLYKKYEREVRLKPLFLYMDLNRNSNH